MPHNDLRRTSELRQRLIAFAVGLLILTPIVTAIALCVYGLVHFVTWTALDWPSWFFWRCCVVLGIFCSVNFALSKHAVED